MYLSYLFACNDLFKINVFIHMFLSYLNVGVLYFYTYFSL